LAEFSYYDAKIKLVDEALFKPLLSLLKELEVYEDTIIVVFSDHGTNLGDHPAGQIPHRSYGISYPQHTTLYDCDLKTLFMIKGRDVPSNHRVKGMVRHIDIAPTVLDLMGVKTVHQFDGISLLPAIKSGQSSGLVAYAEEMYERRGPGDFQALRTDRYKYIIDRRNDDAEEFYDLESDPGEQVNIIDSLNEDERLLRKEMREVADFWFAERAQKKERSEEERKKIDARLRMLGYVK
jgi:arylsulfatase A-like enzyme